MYIRFLEALIPVATVTTFCLAGAMGRFLPGEPTNSNRLDASVVQADEQDKFYLGSDSCFTCHRDQGGSWSDTKHAHAFEHLPEKYRADSSCLKCHVTAFGEEGGYTIGMSAGDAKSYQSVGCETCHGPGSAHVAGVQRWMTADAADEEKLLKEMKAAIHKTPPDSLCANCHKTQSHQTHPPFEGLASTSSSENSSNSPMLGNPATTASAIIPPPSPHSYSVKTCGSCHYEQYKTWRAGSHVGLSTKIPDKYSSDKSCLECHRKSQDTSQWYTASDDPIANENQAQVGCESCHGSGLNHVLFNKQYIAAPPLGPELEQAARQSISKGKPAATCTKCHIQMGHKEHAKYDKPEEPEKPDVAESK